jgi:hypothetical protein
MHRLFTAPAEEVTTELLQDFLDQRMPEGHVVEYKRQVTPEVVEVIASCANTHGGVILVGVDAQRPARDLPGDVPGVPRDAKEDLVNKMNNLLEPPWWSPEVLPVPYGTDGKVVLVIRVDAAAAPRPVMYQGYVPIRMDGRKAKADRRLIKLLLEEPQPVPLEPPETPARPPTHQLSPFYGDGIPAGTTPDLALRLATTLPLWPVARSRVLKKEAIDAVRLALGQSPLHRSVDFNRFEVAAQRHAEPQEPTWDIDRRRATSVYQCLTFGPGRPEQPARPGIRVNCALTHQGRQIEVLLDVLFWLDQPPGQRRPGEPSPSRADDAVPETRLEPLLIADMLSGAIAATYNGILPALTRHFMGHDARWPPPPVEYHLCAGTTATDDNPSSPLTVDQVVDFDSLGERTGLQAVYQCYSGFLEVQEFVDVMALEVMEKIAMDCGYLIPRPLEVPRLPGHIRIETLF